jgi:cobalt transporter subunit CbtA
MKLFQRIFFAAVLSGLAAGLALAAIHQWRAAPLILAAEVYENAAPAEHEHATEAEAAAPHEHDTEAWAPQDGAERIFYTVLADLLASLGFALVLAAVSVLAGMGITLRNGVLWGLGGFVATALAPSFGLPPELPGMPAADLGARQVWWWATVLLTGAGFLAIAKLRTPVSVAIAAVLILAPHIVDAPQLAGEHESTVPAHLAASFAATTLASSAAFWLILGPLLGYLNERFVRASVTSSREAHA